MMKINLTTNTATREGLPQFLQGLKQESLNDLSWTDATLGVQGYGFWQEQDISVIDNATQVFDGTETYTLDEPNFIVKVTRGVRLKTIEELQVEQDELIKAKIVEGETYIKTTVKSVVADFNTKYGVAFDSIYNMAIYKDDVDYPLHTQCNTLVKWQNSMWATARANQASVLDGTMTDEEFIAALPIAPVV